MILKFCPADVEVQVQHARTCVQHRPTFAQSQDPAFHKGGKVKRDFYGFPDQENVDKSLIPPALWLVKDHGIYLMSNGFPRKLLHPNDESSQGLVAYALGFDPEQNPDWYQRLGILEGDDFCSGIAVDFFSNATKPGKRFVHLNITKTHIAVL